ncbi:DUF2268 domain-containing protein [Hymenobacter sp. BT18]|uniref:gliding motility protein GldB-related protein n=1 Tax=Hymenobacter sp. BT18 TaxID=2835648 RepID=UPI00143EE96B|nr:DUF2268 domain-containing putative Zn-dependent protease [Hymenobacter sp. BT18]QIX61345.1 DUF2268 domain-containing protein [Hymenobacter sp. BT18]
MKTSSVALLLSCCLTSLTTFAQRPLAVDSLLRVGQRQYTNKQYQASAATYHLAARQKTALRRQRATALYNEACCYGLQGDANNARKYLEKSIAAGFDDANNLRNDTDLALLHTDKNWEKLVARTAANQRVISRPEDVRLVTTDIDHFWQAYDRAQRDTAHAAEIYQKYYFAKASPGLEDYYASRIYNVPRFVRGIRRKPQFYASIRPTTLALEGMKPRVLGYFQRLKALYPAATFSDVYFLIGGYNSGGTVSRTGLLLGTDQSAGGAGVKTAELSMVQRNRLGPIEELPIVVVHEMIHNIQLDGNGTLLHAAINEGMADFLAGLVSETKGANPRLFTYGDAHEKQLWAEFEKEMGGKDWSHWIANSQEETAERPCDLGYYIGYKICEAYYEQAPDKKQAVADMLNLKDATAFLAKSGYAQKALSRN